VNNQSARMAGRKPQTLTREFKLINIQGMHARPAALFVKTATRYESDITVVRDRQTVSGKSIMGLMTLEAPVGTLLRVTASGPDAWEVLNELQSLVDAKFFED
jgi:phosphocarrier protein HPr